MNLRELRCPIESAMQSGLLVLVLQISSLISSAHAAEFFVPDGDVERLIEAINQANDEVTYPGMDLIKLVPGGTYTLHRQTSFAGGNNGLPLITSDIIIEADGEEPAMIRRSDEAQTPEFRFFFVEWGGTLVLRNIALEGGRPGAFPQPLGGAIYNKGSVLLDRSILVRNHAFSGGGIYTITDPDRDRLGGARAGMSGRVQLRESFIIENTAINYGGGIYSRGIVQGLEIPEGQILSEIRQNSARQGGGMVNEFGVMGGAFWVHNNSATDSCGGILNIGGLLFLNGTWVDLNHAAVFGGGICSLKDKRGALAELSMYRTNVGGNRAVASGAGIYAEGRTLISSSNIYSNRLSPGAEVDKIGVGIFGSKGGGIYNAGWMMIVESYIRENMVVAVWGFDEMYSTGFNAYGGGIYNASRLDMEFVRIHDNEAWGGAGFRNPGGIGGDGGNAYGAGLYNEKLFKGEAVTIFGNYAYEGWGEDGRIEGRSGNSLGGGVFNQGEAVFSGAYIGTNFARGGGGVFTGVKSESNFHNTTIAGNSAANFGGGIATATSSSSLLEFTTVAFNDTDNLIGGLFNYGEMVLSKSIVAGNTGTTERHNDCYNIGPFGIIRAADYNLFGDHIYCPAADTDLDLGTLGAEIDTVLGPLTEYTRSTTLWEFTTMAHPLLSGSPAIDMSPREHCVHSYDQRWFVRPRDGDGDGVGDCDSGAIEY